MYATQADMEKRFPASELVSLTAKNGGTVIDAGVLNEALASATACIDAYLSGRYAVPLATVPDVLIGKCCDIARYELDPRPPEDVIKRNSNALAFLRDVQSGKASLPLPTGGEAPSKGSIHIASSGRTFTKDSLADY